MLNYFALRYRTTSRKMYHFFCWNVRNARPFKSQIQLPKEINTSFFLSGFSFTDTDDQQNSRGEDRTIFYSTLPFPLSHEHSDIYLQLCMWDDHHIFLIAPFVFTRQRLDEIYHLIQLPFDWLMMRCYFLFVYLMIWY